MLGRKMIIHCPSCETTFKSDSKEEPLPSTCPECGADLYPEEIIYQQMISEPDKDGILV